MTGRANEGEGRGAGERPGARGGRVAIVGGGLAGIAAALDCADAGARVTLLEVRPRLGGAAYSFERDGLRLDNGQHVFLRCCTEYIALLERLGSRRLTTLQPRLDIPVIAPGGRAGRLRRSSLPAPLHLAAALARYPHLGPADRARAARAALALRRLDPEDPRLDARTFGDWLAAHGQRPAAMEALWDLIARPTLNLPAAEASLGQAVQVFRTGLLDAPDAGDVGWASAPLGDVHDVAARGALAAAGVDVRLRWRAERVARAGAHGWSVAGPGNSVAADAVVVAVPHDRVEALVPPGALAAPERLRALGTSPIVNLHVAYDRPVTDHAFVAAIRSPVQFVFDRTRSAGLERGQLLAVSLSAADAEMEARPDELRARYLPALAELFPAARAATVERFVVTREHAATFRAAPGSAALRPPAATALAGLALAGAHTATGWPATMEGAVRSGHAAARSVLAGLVSAPAHQAVAA
jgi:squalene-associated FAD-dependent desaturase